MVVDFPKLKDWEISRLPVRLYLLACIGLLGILHLGNACSEVQVNTVETSKPSDSSEWKLTWSDEFDGPVGAPVNDASWVFDLGGGGWGNREKEYYTNDPQNIALNGTGQLVITARVAPAGLACFYGECKYTSARIKTKAKVEPLYGRVEARIKLPEGQGLWPAFWLLGNNIPSTPWPGCGEIDIMEYKGSVQGSTSSAMHGPGYSGNTPLVHAFNLPSGAFSDDFHLFAVEWEAEQVRFYVDETLHYTVTKENVQRYGKWVFDHPFFILLNLAVGGNFDGDPRNDDIFPATMQVDYVRVYTRSAASLP